jgi:rhodanese-related sulfurtransferase
MTMHVNAPLLRDTAWVAIAGCAVALVANAVSPRGLSLSRDYFAGNVTADAPAHRNRTDDAAPTPIAGAPAGTARTARGFQLASHAEVLRLFQDPRREQQRILFVDARNDAQYVAGHIPGACQLDHYHLDRTVGSVLGLAQVAEQVVVYCNGGDCEDSALAALDLVSLGVAQSKLLIYGGGFTEWRRQGLPLQRGRTTP